MRIQQLDLIRFGCFTDELLDLSHDGIGLHIIYGANEAGKSSALRGLEALLFGFEAQTPDNFLHDYSRLRVGGWLCNGDGTELRFRRRKGTKRTVLGEEERALPDDALAPYLHGLSKERFREMFGMDHPRLVAGGASLLSEGGEIGQALLAASAGGAQVRQLLRELEEEAGLLYKPSGTNPIINQLLTACGDARKARADASLSGREWEEHDDALRQAQADRQRAVEQLADSADRKAWLEALQEILPLLAARGHVLDQLRELGDVVALEEGFTDTRRETDEALRRARDRKQRAEAELERLGHEISQIHVPEGIVAQEPAIMALYRRLGGYLKAQEDLPALRRSYEEHQALAQGMLFDLPIPMDLQQLEELRLSETDRSLIQDLATDYATTTVALSKARDAVAELTRLLARARSELARMPVPPDVTGLKLALDQVRPKAGTEEALKRARADAQKLKAAIAVAAEQLTPSLPEGADPETVPAPLPETVQRFVEEFQRVSAEIERVTERIQGVSDDLRDVNEQLDALRLGQAVPSEEELEAERGRREEGWQLVRRAWQEGADVAGEAAEYDAERELSEAYEHHVVEADGIADRLRREADRVAMQSQLLARRRALESDLTDSKARLARALVRQRQLEGEWAEQWRESGITPLPPAEMDAWLTRLASVRAQVRQLSELMGEIAGMVEETTAYRALLAGELLSIGAVCPGDDEPLSMLLERCQEVVDDSEAQARARAAAEGKVKDLEGRLDTAVREEQEYQEQLRQWQERWAKSLVPFGLHDDMLPTTAIQIIGKLQEAKAHLKEAKGLCKRIRDIQTDAERFTEDAHDLLAQFCPDMHGRPVEQAVSELHARLSRALQDETKRAGLSRQMEAQEAIRREAREAINASQRVLGDLCRQAQVEKPDLLPEAERRWGEYQRLRGALVGLEDQLRRAGRGRSLEEIEAEATDVDPATIPGKIQASDAERKQLEGELSLYDQRIGEERQILRSMDGRGTAAEKAEQAQRWLAELEGRAQQYARLRVAAALLRAGVKEYREQNQAPVLQRAAQLFSQLTLGSFMGLVSDLDDSDRPVLVGVRPSGEQVQVGGMSDGTRDQLHLALRLSCLERYLAAHEPMPFIVDDILIRFDDERARAALEVLSGLSAATQVIFLTHHRRLVELAEQLAGPAALHVLRAS